MSPLHFELIDAILSHCTNGSLARCALTNHTLLELSRSHLYRHIHWAHQWATGGLTILNSVAAHPYLVSHTRYLSMNFFNVDATDARNALPQLVNDLQGFGKLECLTLSPLWSSSLRFKPLFLSLVRIPSLISISLSLDENMGSPCFIPFISSPKLRSLSLILATWNEDEDGVTTPDFVVLNPSLQFLFHSPDRLDLSNIRHLVVTFMQAEVVTVYIVKLLTACSNVTHLTLRFKALLLEQNDTPASFIPIQRLRSLTSLTIDAGIDMSTIDQSLDQFHFIFQQLPPKAPMRCIILEIYWISASQIESHPTLATLRSILKSRHEPPCQLEIKVGREHLKSSLIWRCV